MAISHLIPPQLRGIVSSVPKRRFDNLADTVQFPKEDVEKVVRMAGVKARRVADDETCSSDLCRVAATELLQQLGWSPDSIDGLIFVTQSPDYFLPSTACLLHRALGLSPHCAAFDLGLGCSGYPYGLSLATMMLQSSGYRRLLLLHGETPTRFSDQGDRSVALLFGDAGSATALEADPEAAQRSRWTFDLQTDGTGSEDLIIRGGGYRKRFPTDPRDCFVNMNGANVFNFTIKRIPALIQSTLAAAQRSKAEVDYFIFHQSNQFIIKHLAKKEGLPESKLPLTLGEFGSVGGPSIPLTLTQGGLQRPPDRSLSLLLLGYGVGLSWGSALIDLAPTTHLGHVEYP
ncbi:MAG: ketoacyl-ACP synthase III [Verrucomicrobiales bacterium]|nr:ketoacyl-ACP synthase III [Verrucomicrobiales bacterium]